MYIIIGDGLFNKTYVSLDAGLRKPHTINLNTHKEALEMASKFRYKLYAKFICYLCNKYADKKGHLIKFVIKEI